LASARWTASTRPNARANDWGTPQVNYLPMKLTAGANSVKVSNPTGYIADIDWITV
jgi:hypothetical protein